MATSNPNSISSLPEIRQSDLKDPTLGLLNNVLRNFIWNRIVSLSGGAGAIKLQDVVVAPAIQIPSQTVPPTDPNTVITLGTALSLFSPGNTRQAILSGAFQTNATSVQDVQPTPTSGGGITTTVNFSGGFTVGGTSYTNMIFQGGVLVGFS